MYCEGLSIYMSSYVSIRQHTPAYASICIYVLILVYVAYYYLSGGHVTMFMSHTTIYTSLCLILSIPV